MALYAANNILRGIRNYDNEKKRVAGILYNRRDIEGEDEHVLRFAQAVGLPICAVIPRSDAFIQAERTNMTVIEQGSDRDIIDIFLTLARKIANGCTLYAAKPLTDELLEVVVQGVPENRVQPVLSRKSHLLRKPERRRFRFCLKSTLPIPIGICPRMSYAPSPYTAVPLTEPCL